MKEQFEFNMQPCPMSILDIENIFQCAVEATNAEGEYYYLVALTSLGVTSIFTCGPVVPDVFFLPNGYSTNLTRHECDDKKVSKFINSWLNDRYKKLQEAKIISFKEAKEQFRDICEYLDEYGKEGIY